MTCDTTNVQFQDNFVSINILKPDKKAGVCLTHGRNMSAFFGRHLTHFFEHILFEVKKSKKKKLCSVMRHLSPVTVSCSRKIPCVNKRVSDIGKFFENLSLVLLIYKNLK
jgi:hypothetical protein